MGEHSTPPVIRHAELAAEQTIAREVVERYSQLASVYLKDVLEHDWTKSPNPLFLMTREEVHALELIDYVTQRIKDEMNVVDLRLLASMEIRLFAAIVSGDMTDSIKELVSLEPEREGVIAEAICNELMPLARYNESCFVKNPYTPPVGIEVESRLGHRDPKTGVYTSMDSLRWEELGPYSITDRSYMYLRTVFLGPYKSGRETIYGKSEGDVDEISTRAYAHVYFLLRDVIQMFRSGIIPERKSHTVHITIGDMALHDADPRAMIISLIVWAEGYAGYYKNKGPIVRESVTKSDFPFHDIKIVSNEDKYGPVKEPHTSSDAVEFRSLWKIHSLEDLKHVVKGIYYLSIPLIATQMIEGGILDDAISNKLRYVWHQAELNFKSLLSENGVDMGPFYESFEQISSYDSNVDLDDAAIKDAYGGLLGKIRTLQRTNPKFRDDVRALVVKVRLAVNDILETGDIVD